MRTTLAFALWLSTCGLAGADTCALNAWGAPKHALTYPGVARGPATKSEIDSQTAIAVSRARAPLSPKYADMPRAFVYFQMGGKRRGTIAAVVDGVMPKPGEAVTLVERHRDPDVPCAFVPWTITKETAGKPTT
jgi:hypothetical protein